MVAAYLTKPPILLASESKVVVARWDAVVFDLDGTLVDTAPDLHAHLNEMLADLGRPGFALDDVRPMIGDGARMLLRRGLDASGGMPAGVDLEALFAEFLRRYTAPAYVQDERKRLKLLKDLPAELEKELLPYKQAAGEGLFTQDCGGEAAAKDDFSLGAAGQLKGGPASLKVEDFWSLEPAQAAAAALEKSGS